MFGIFEKNSDSTTESSMSQFSVIVIGDYKEYMVIPLNYWSIKDYKKSWIKSIEEGLLKKNHAALIVSYVPEQIVESTIDDDEDISLFSNDQERKIYESAQKLGFHQVIAASNFVTVWVIYFEDNNIFIQNRLLFLDQCIDFSPYKVNKFIEQRRTYNEDGMEISEWNTDIDSIIDFYNSLKDSLKNDIHDNFNSEN